jgi:hypothetical protein
MFALDDANNEAIRYRLAPRGRLRSIMTNIKTGLNFPSRINVEMVISPSAASMQGIELLAAVSSEFLPLLFRHQGSGSGA